MKPARVPILTRRPDLPVLTVVLGWGVAGVLAILAETTRWPLLASLVLSLPGWGWLSACTGLALAMGATVALASAMDLRDSTRWALEQPACTLLAAGWITYAIIAAASGSWGVVVMASAQAGACLIRLAQAHSEERLGRILTGREDQER